MLIKTKDDVEPALQTLTALLATPGLTQIQKERIEEEISNIRVGARGERDAAYHIDFRLKDAKNYVIAHDLRIEHNGRVAQIDHLLIGRFFDIILIESKRIGTAVRITEESEFEVKTRYGWRGMASPVEQSKRHAQVLGELVSDLDLLPKRLGFQIRPNFHHWILVPPECHIVRQSTEATIIKMDMFGKRMDEWMEKSAGGVLAMTKVVSRETLTDFVRALTLHHKPITMNFAAKFGVTESASTLPPTPTPTPTPAIPPPIPPIPTLPAAQPEPKPSEPVACEPGCEDCGSPLEERVITFCRANPKKFNGKLLCRKCQIPSKTPPACSDCGVAIDDKVVAFCRYNSRKFNKRLLCRPCQGMVTM